jgi:hypothetical protein
MEPEEITLLTVIILGVVSLMLHWFKEKVRPRRLAIIEDSDDDYRMLKMFCDFENVVITRYRTGDNLHMKFAIERPDVVIADYYLDGRVTGADIIKLCDKFRIPAKLVTGTPSTIQGVPEQRILRKSPDREYFDRLTDWTHQQLA